MAKPAPVKPTFDRLIASIPPESLDSEVRQEESVISLVAARAHCSPETLGNGLGLKPMVVDDVVREFSGDKIQQRGGVVRRWIQIDRKKATLRKLLNALYHRDEIESIRLVNQTFSSVSQDRRSFRWAPDSLLTARAHPSFGSPFSYGPSVSYTVDPKCVYSTPASDFSEREEPVSPMVTGEGQLETAHDYHSVLLTGATTPGNGLQAEEQDEEIHKLQDENKSLRETLEAKVDEEAEQDAKIQQLHKENQALRDALEDKEDQIWMLNNRLDAVQRRLDELQEEKSLREKLEAKVDENGKDVPDSSKAESDVQQPGGVPAKWRKGHSLGKGSFGEVFVCEDTIMGHQLAVKIIPIKKGKTFETREVSLLKKLRHERIVLFYGTETEEVADRRGKTTTYLHIFMEYMPGESIHSYLEIYGPLEEALARKFTVQLLEGVAYLHLKKVVHRDIKGANILRDSHGNIKLGGFGSSKELRDITIDRRNSHDKGTAHWRAPESIRGDHDFKSDVWSVGATVMEMLTAQPPFSTLSPGAVIFGVGSNRLTPTISEEFSREARVFLQQCFKSEHSQRPSANHLLSESFCLLDPQDFQGIRLQEETKSLRERLEPKVDEIDLLTSRLDEVQMRLEESESENERLRTQLRKTVEEKQAVEHRLHQVQLDLIKNGKDVPDSSKAISAESDQDSIPCMFTCPVHTHAQENDVQQPGVGEERDAHDLQEFVMPGTKAGSLEREMETTDGGVVIKVKVGAFNGHFESAIAGDSQTHSVDLLPRFRGVHVLSGSAWHVSVTSEAKKIQWDEIGVLFNIPEGAVPPDEVLNLTVWPCIKGPFVPPPGYHFASPVFIVGPEFIFEKKILFQLSHFIQLQSSDDCEKMVFLSARSTSLSSKDGKITYHFKVLEGGSFEVGQPVGTISLSHICAVAVGEEINAGGKVHYSLQLHHSEEARKAVFVVSIVDKVYTKNVEDFLEKQYPNATFEHSIKQPVEFAAENEVTLYIPNPTDSMSGWVILSDINPCKISRQEVDFPLLHSEAPCQIPDYPPKLVLSLEQSHPPQRPFHQCSLSVGGLKQPWTFTPVLRKSKHPGPPALQPLSQQPCKGNTTVGRLSCDDLCPVLNELVTVCAEWENIGLQLKLLPGTLDGIKGAHRPPKDCLRDMLKIWLNTSPNPSWQHLIEALRSRLVGQDALARKLESK